MVAGASWLWWVGFHLVVVGLLVADWLLHSRSGREKPSTSMAWFWTAVLLVAALAFAGWIAYAQSRQSALEFIGGYAIEGSLSVDNLVVFLAIFQGFGVGPQRQHTALRWGVAGAIVLRALFIAAGIALLRHFAWIPWIFGLILLYAAWRFVVGGSAKAAVPSWVRKLQPAATARSQSVSLLPVIVMIECTDLIFAVDSIPAVLAVSHNPFVVYTSNIAAVLGLRTLYVALASLLDRLRYLHYGLGALLAFVAFKMLAARWIEVPITISLVMVGAILAVCVLASLLAGRSERECQPTTPRK
jgi:tellurite resistance protein TerC